MNTDRIVEIARRISHAAEGKEGNERTKDFLKGAGATDMDPLDKRIRFRLQRMELLTYALKMEFQTPATA